MISYPASRSARATTLRPRSCPSSPGFASRRRKALAISSIVSDDRGFAVLAVHAPQHPADLSQGHVGFDALQDRVHGVARAFGRTSQGVQTTPSPRSVAIAAYPLRACHLPALDIRIDAQDRDRPLFGYRKRVAADPDMLPTSDLPLV